MGTNPNYTVRFYVRTTKTQGGDSPTPLRVKVWVSDTKSYLYYSTSTTTTKRIWADFANDGTPSPNADPALVKVVDTYKTATQLVMASAIANERIKEMTSESLSLRVDAVVTYLKMRQDHKNLPPLLVFTTPINVPLCQNCIHCGEVCSAKWDSKLQASTASDVALCKSTCPKRKAKEDAITAIPNAIGKALMRNASIEMQCFPELTEENAVAIAFLKLADYYKAHKDDNKVKGGNDDGAED